MKQDGTLVHIAAGGASGAVARTCVAPIERVKIIYQIDRSGGQRGYRHILPNIFKEEGFFGFWRGNSAAVLRVIPYMSCQFGFLEYYKSLLTKYGFPGDDIVIVRGNAKGALDHPGDEAFNACIGELMDALDNNIPAPEREADKPFLMAIEDVFSIAGRGTVVTGRIEQGVITVGDKVEIVGLRDTQETTCTGVEMFQKTLNEGQAGDNVGILLRGTKKEDVERGQVLAAKGSIPPHTKFEGQVYVLSKDEGGRHTPFFNGYRPQFYFRTTDVTGSTTLRGGAEMCMPGDNVEVEVELGKPIAMSEGSRFAIREGGRTVGSGVVTKIVE